MFGCVSACTFLIEIFHLVGVSQKSNCSCVSALIGSDVIPYVSGVFRYLAGSSFFSSGVFFIQFSPLLSFSVF